MQQQGGKATPRTAGHYRLHKGCITNWLGKLTSTTGLSDVSERKRQPQGTPPPPTKYIRQEIALPELISKWAHLSCTLLCTTPRPRLDRTGRTRARLACPQGCASSIYPAIFPTRVYKFILSLSHTHISSSIASSHYQHTTSQFDDSQHKHLVHFPPQSSWLPTPSTAANAATCSSSAPPALPASTPNVPRAVKCYCASRRNRWP